MFLQHDLEELELFLFLTWFQNQNVLYAYGILWKILVQVEKTELWFIQSVRFTILFSLNKQEFEHPTVFCGNPLGILCCMKMSKLHKFCVKKIIVFTYTRYFFEKCCSSEKIKNIFLMLFFSILNICFFFTCLLQSKSALF